MLSVVELFGNFKEVNEWLRLNANLEILQLREGENIIKADWVKSLELCRKVLSDAYTRIYAKESHICILLWGQIDWLTDNIATGALNHIKRWLFHFREQDYIYIVKMDENAVFVLHIDLYWFPDFCVENT